MDIQPSFDVSQLLPDDPVLIANEFRVSPANAEAIVNGEHVPDRVVASIIKQVFPPAKSANPDDPNLEVEAELQENGSTVIEAGAVEAHVVASSLAVEVDVHEVGTNLYLLRKA